MKWTNAAPSVVSML